MDKATTIFKLFSRETSVSININSSLKNVWNILTNISNYPSWNSTIISIEGNLNEGGKLELKSQLDPNRIFKLTVKEFAPESRIVWGDSMGQRVFTITSNNEGGTTFTMSEKIGGPLFPLFAKMIPSFDESFEKFARDLKVEAEKPNI